MWLALSVACGRSLVNSLSFGRRRNVENTNVESSHSRSLAITLSPAHLTSCSQLLHFFIPAPETTVLQIKIMSIFEESDIFRQTCIHVSNSRPKTVVSTTTILTTSNREDCFLWIARNDWTATVSCGFHRSKSFVQRHINIPLGRQHPFFGVQWHPEKAVYEWRANTTVPHTKNAISATQYLANFFTEQARQNQNYFESTEDELKHLIYQYTPEFLGLIDSHFQQVYFFNELIEK